MALPFVSIIIPTIGRFNALQQCLEAVSQLSYPLERLEVIVVFDGCAPINLPDIELLTVRILSQPHSGPGAARNYGAREANGDYLAFIDDDCLPSSLWLQVLTAVFNNHPKVMAGGTTINALPDNPYASASQLLVDYLYEQSNARFFASNNMALPRELFLAWGGFDESFPLAAGEDRELCDRWRNNGGEMVYVPESVVHHAHDLEFSSFWQQHINYGRGAFRYRQKMGGEEKKRLESLGFYVNLLLFPLKRAKGRRAVQLFLLFLLMQTATAFGYLKERLSPGK